MKERDTLVPGRLDSAQLDALIIARGILGKKPTISVPKLI